MSREGEFARPTGRDLRKIAAAIYPYSKKDILTGNFYTNHPDGFIFPTVALYAIFGVSEATTRLGPVLMMLLALGLFAYALRKIFKNNFKAWLSTLILAILPGFIFYGETLEISSAALAAALACFSLFVLCFPEQKKVNLFFFYFSIFIGGLFGWFFYLMALLLWLYLLFSRMPGKIKPLIFMPIAALAAIIAWSRRVCFSLDATAASS